MTVSRATPGVLEFLGPTLEFLTPDDNDDDPCVLRGTIPAGVVVPLHSHADVETFVGVSGELESYLDGEWSRLGPGDVVHVPGHHKHAWRNVSDGPAVTLAVTTQTLGRFFREVGVRVPAPPPTPERIEHFLQTSARYGHWNATPEENAAIGLELP